MLWLSTLEPDDSHSNRDLIPLNMRQNRLNLNMSAILPGLSMLLLVLGLLSGTSPLTARAQSADGVTVQATINVRREFDLGSKLKPGETVTAVDAAAHGAISIDSGGAGHYLGNANFIGEDSSRAWVTDSSGATRAIPIAFTVSGSPVSVEARGDAVSIDEDTPVTLFPLANDAAGPGGGTLAATIEEVPAAGTAEVLADGSLLFTPASNWFGQVRFTYRASDGATSMVTTIDVDVRSVPDLPTANPDAVVVRQGENASIDVLVNDLDGDGDPFWFNGNDQPLYGTATWSDGDRMIIYSPAPDFYGVDSFTYYLADGSGVSSGLATVTVDGRPSATDDLIAVALGSSSTFDPTVNDVDPEAAALLVSAVSSAANGDVTINLDNTVTYIADSDNVESDAFTYTITDPAGNSATATVLVQRGDQVASPPEAGEDEFLVMEDSIGNTLDLLGNDRDPNGGALILTIESSPEHGALVVDAMQSVTYVPSAEYSGSDSFTYAITGSGGTTESIVEISVQAQNDLPVAVADYAETNEDVPVTINVLANDTDIDGDVLLVESVTTGALGSATTNPDGTVTYSPNPNASGTDQISYVVSDGFGGTAMMTIDVLTRPAPDAPVALDDAVATDPGKQVDIAVLANDVDPDGDPLSALTISVEPKHGTTQIQADGKVTYLPVAAFEGIDSFSYTVTDPGGLPAEATVEITVGTPNRKPEASPDTDKVRTGKSVRIDVLGNDSDPDSDVLSIYRVGKPQNGTAVIRSGTIIYRPNDGFIGTDEFTYRVSDGTDTDTGRVTVTVVKGNDAPLAKDDAAVVVSGDQVEIDVLANDSDAEDGTPGTLRIIGEPRVGTATVSDGVITYQSVVGSSGQVVITYEVEDSGGKSSRAQILIKLEK